MDKIDYELIKPTTKDYDNVKLYQAAYNKYNYYRSRNSLDKYLEVICKSPFELPVRIYNYLASLGLVSNKNENAYAEVSALKSIDKNISSTSKESDVDKIDVKLIIKYLEEKEEKLLSEVKEIRRTKANLLKYFN